MKKLFSVLLAAVMAASVLAGCGGNNSNAGGSGAFADVAYKANEEALKYSDSSEMPDWEGEQIELTMWYANASYSGKKNDIAENDVVSPEWARVTGVKFSPASFDNNGELVDAKLSKIIASKEWPDILMGCPGNTLNTMIEEDLIWDLTELIPQYMPNLNAYLEKGDFGKSKRPDGKLYEVDLGVPLRYAYPDMSEEVLVRNTTPQSTTSSIWVRDDILKMIKPEAYTQAEILEKYENNQGKFTKEEILNASINSKEEFFQFLRDIKALGIKEGNREVYPTFAFAGSDNWGFMTFLAGYLQGFYGSPGNAGSNYFTYYDVETEKVEYMFDKPFFKEILKEFTELVREDVISEDSLIDNRSQFQEKCSSGQYAVLYGSEIPSVVTLNNNAEGYQYRKVTLNIPFNTEKFAPLLDELTGGTRYAFLKSEISAEELPQVLRAFDFMITDVGQKLIQWGPKTAGLFTEDAEGNRRYTDKEIEDAAVYGKANDSLVKYGLDNKAWPGYAYGMNRWKPIYVYDFVPNVSRLQMYYTTAIEEPLETVQGVAPNIWQFTANVPELKTAFDARTDFEKAMTKCLTAKTDEEFEEFYQTFVDKAVRSGYTEEALAKANEYWETIVNEPYMKYLDEFLAKVK